MKIYRAVSLFVVVAFGLAGCGGSATSPTSGNTIPLSYNGGFFPRSISITASIPNGAGGTSIGTAQLLQQNNVCDYTQPGLQNFTLNLLSPGDYLTKGLFVSASVGYANPTSTVMKRFQI